MESMHGYKNIHDSSPDGLSEIINIECFENSIVLDIRFIGCVIAPDDPVGVSGETRGTNSNYLGDSEESHIKKKTTTSLRQQMLSVVQNIVKVDDKTGLIFSLDLVTTISKILREGYVYKPSDFKWRTK